MLLSQMMIIWTFALLYTLNNALKQTFKYSKNDFSHIARPQRQMTCARLAKVDSSVCEFVCASE